MEGRYGVDHGGVCRVYCAVREVGIWQENKWLKAFAKIRRSGDSILYRDQISDVRRRTRLAKSQRVGLHSLRSEQSALPAHPALAAIKTLVDAGSSRGYEDFVLSAKQKWVRGERGLLTPEGVEPYE